MVHRKKQQLHRVEKEYIKRFEDSRRRRYAMWVYPHGTVVFLMKAYKSYAEAYRELRRRAVGNIYEIEEV